LSRSGPQTRFHYLGFSDYARDGHLDEGKRRWDAAMQERKSVWQKRTVSVSNYLLIQSPPASRKEPGIDVVALDKLEESGDRQAIIVVPERSSAQFSQRTSSQFGFVADWEVKPKLESRQALAETGGKVDAVRPSLESGDSGPGLQPCAFGLPLIDSAWTL